MTRVGIGLLLAVALGLAACVPADPEPEGSLLVVAKAGPICPVETDPPDPDCAPRPVAEAVIVVRPADGNGSVVAEGETDADGQLTLALPAGNYLVTAGPVEGLIAAPEPALVTVVAGVSIELPIAYDTGIR